MKVVTFGLLVCFLGTSFAQSISAHFNQNERFSYTDPYRKIRRYGENLEQILINVIRSAKREIQVAVQEISLPLLARELIQAKNRGVDVKIVMENIYNKPFIKLSESQKNELDPQQRQRYEEKFSFIDVDGNNILTKHELQTRDAMTMLKESSIPIVDDTFDGSMGSGLMHHKFVVVDKMRLVVSSANFTLSGVHGDFRNIYSRGNANALVVMFAPSFALQFSKEFDVMFGNGVKGSGQSRFGINKRLFPEEFEFRTQSWRVRGMFSATSESADWRRSTNAFIGRQLSYAQKSVKMALFVFSEQKLVNILERRHEKGLDIGLLMHPSFISQYYSESLDMWGLEMKKDSCLYEYGNRPWRAPSQKVGIPRLAMGDKLHHKFAVIDGKKVIFGSQNWSPAGAHKNDESVLVIEEKKVAEAFTREYERLERTATWGPSKKLLSDIKERERLCSLRGF